MKRVAIVVLLLFAAGCIKKQANGSYRIDNPLAEKRAHSRARDKESAAVKKIKSGSREVAQGVKEGATELARKVEAAGKKVEKEVKTDTRH